MSLLSVRLRVSPWGRRWRIVAKIGAKGGFLSKLTPPEPPRDRLSAVEFAKEFAEKELWRRKRARRGVDYRVIIQESIETAEVL